MAVLSGTSGFFSGDGFSFALMLLVVGRAYPASLALVNGCTGSSSFLSTSSSVVGGDGGCQAAGTGGGTGETGVGAGVGVGCLVAVGPSKGGSGS